MHHTLRLLGGMEEPMSTQIQEMPLFVLTVTEVLKAHLAVSTIPSATEQLSVEAVTAYHLMVQYFQIQQEDIVFTTHLILL